MARKKDIDSLIVEYEKWYTVFFWYDTQRYVFCKEDDKFTFKSFEMTPESEFAEGRVKIVQMDLKLAEEVAQQFDEFEFAGYVREVEVIPNYLLTSNHMANLIYTEGYPNGKNEDDGRGKGSKTKKGSVDTKREPAYQ